MKKELKRKLKIESLIHCINCSRFPACPEDKKENVADCSRYREIALKDQVVVIMLEEYCQLTTTSKKK